MSNCFVTPPTVACQAPQSMGFPRQEYWSGLPFPCFMTCVCGSLKISQKCDHSLIFVGICFFVVVAEFAFWTSCRSVIFILHFWKHRNISIVVVPLSFHLCFYTYFIFAKNVVLIFGVPFYCLCYHVLLFFL